MITHRRTAAIHAESHTKLCATLVPFLTFLRIQLSNPRRLRTIAMAHVIAVQQVSQLQQASCLHVVNQRPRVSCTAQIVSFSANRCNGRIASSLSSSAMNQGMVARSRSVVARAEGQSQSSSQAVQNKQTAPPDCKWVWLWNKGKIEGSFHCMFLPVAYEYKLYEFTMNPPYNLPTNQLVPDLPTRSSVSPHVPACRMFLPPSSASSSQ